MAALNDRYHMQKEDALQLGNHKTCLFAVVSGLLVGRTN